MPNDKPRDQEGRHEHMAPAAAQPAVDEDAGLDLSKIVQVSTRVEVAMRIRLRRAAADRDLPIQDVQKLAFQEFLERHGY